MPMQMGLSVYQKLEMKMRLSPQIIQSIEILQLPTLELQQRINQELMENPLLEQQDPALEMQAPDAMDEPKDERTTSEAEFDKMLEMEERMSDYSSQAPTRPSQNERDGKMEAMQNTADNSQTLQQYLASQLNLLDLSEQEEAIAQNIVYNLDNNGYLQYPLEEIVASMAIDTTVFDAERVLHRVQALDPPGVGARDLRECLLLQLAHGAEDELPETHDRYELERILILNHLEDLQYNRLPKIVKETGRTMAEVREAADFVCQLNPRPGAAFTDERPLHIVPDVEVREENGHYEVVMCDDYTPRLRISHNYMKLLRSESATEEEKEYIKQKLQSAKWLIDSVGQRRSTLYKIMTEIVKVQGEFFEKGVRYLKPLRMGPVAEAAGVHVSTVSRAIADKYALTPRGLFEIRFFFAGSAQAENDEGEGTARASVMDLIREAVDKEDKTKPLSDGDLMAMLKKRGVEVSRRTVTKYRQVMNIRPSRQRIEY